jgi:hypothetical protein
MPGKNKSAEWMHLSPAIFRFGWPRWSIQLPQWVICCPAASRRSQTSYPRDVSDTPQGPPARTRRRPNLISLVSVADPTAEGRRGFCPGGTNSAPPPPRRHSTLFSVSSRRRRWEPVPGGPNPYQTLNQKLPPKKSAKNQKKPNRDGGAGAVGGGGIRVGGRIAGFRGRGGGIVPGDLAVRGGPARERAGRAALRRLQPGRRRRLRPRLQGHQLPQVARLRIRQLQQPGRL